MPGIPLALGVAIIASGSFVLGQQLNHTHIMRNLSKLIKTNPYAFYLKDKLHRILTDVPAEDDGPPNNMPEIMKYGFPGLDDLRVFSDFVMSYDRRNRVAHWVFEHLTVQSVADISKVNPGLAEFRSDMAVPSLFRSHNQDYFRSEFGRVHLAAATNHTLCQRDWSETFYLTNVAPQMQGFNREAWNNLEIYCRHLTNVYPDVYVCTGPVYMPQLKQNYKSIVEYPVIGCSSVAVPTHFFKVILCESADHQFSVESYLLRNQFNINSSHDLNNNRQPLELIERVTGLHFFEKINRNEFVSVNGRPYEPPSNPMPSFWDINHTASWRL